MLYEVITAGLSSGFTSGLGNGLLEGKSFNNSVLNGLIYGGIGGLTGGAIGGISGGISAASHGRRFWDGASVQRTTLVEHNIPVVGQRGRLNCAPATGEAIDASFGGSMSQEQIRALPSLGGDPDAVPLGDITFWDAYATESGHSIST